MAILTDRAVLTLKPDLTRRVERPDGAVPGLAIRVNRESKSWVLYYRVGRRLRRWTMGSYPVLGVAAARRKARHALAALATTGAWIRRRPNAPGARPTVRCARGRVTGARQTEEEDQWGQDDLLLRTILVPAWEPPRPERPYPARRIKDLLAAIVDRGAPVMANRTQALISTMFNFALRKTGSILQSGGTD